MKGILASSLGTMLGLLPATCQAQEAQWRAAKPSSAPVPATLPADPSVVRVAFETRPSPELPLMNAVAPPSGRVVSAETLARWLAERPRPDLPAIRCTPVVRQTSAIDRTPRVTARAKSEDNPEKPTSLPAPGTLPVAPGSGTPIPPPVCPDTYPSYLLCGNPFAVAAMTDVAPRWQFSAEYLLWWARGADVPPLVTTSPPGQFGFLPGAAILLGGNDLDTQFRQGARFGAVYWFDDCASCGFDGRIFFTGRVVDRFAVNSDTFPNLFRPFLAANPGLGEFSEQVTVAGRSIGGVHAENRSFFWGAEANYRDNLCCGCFYRTDLIAGFRFLQLNESLTITEDITRQTPAQVQDFPGGPVVTEPVGTRIIAQDRFATSNNFYGGQLGLVNEYRRDRWVIDLRTAVALGSTNQQLTIQGSQVRQIPGQPPQGFVGGLLALNSNIGVYSRNAFTVVPEIGINVGYQVTDHLKAFVGYNFLYLSNVIRPGEQIDPVIDVTRIPRFVPPGVNVPPANEVRPAVLFRETDFWAQGVNLGLEYRW